MKLFLFLFYRCAKRTSKDRVSSQREVDLSASRTPARSPHIIYNSDTVYSTTTFRPVSPSPITPPLSTPSPQRTRKLETPLHLDGGLFSDIRSADGKLLSTVTVDRVHSSTRHDVSDEPNAYESTGLHRNKDYVDDFVKTETITNEDVIKVKFTPVLPELDCPRLLTPSQYRGKTPVEYLKDNFEDLHSYKIVSSVCKERLYETDHSSIREKSFDTISVAEPVKRPPSPLANFLVSDQLTKIDTYLQESLDTYSLNGDTTRPSPNLIKEDIETKLETKDIQNSGLNEQMNSHVDISANNTISSYQDSETRNNGQVDSTATNASIDENIIRRKSKLNIVKVKQPGALSAIYNLPIHYHATIICFLLIVYNLIYQYIKQNCHGNK